MKLFRGIALVTILLATTSACDFIKKLKGGGDEDAAAEAGVAAADEAGAAPTTPPPAAGAAANEDDIARFPDEAKLADVAASVKRPYNVRDAPPAGAVVAGVRPGQGVTQIASRGNYTLITFDDAASGKKLMGWVHKDAFSPQLADAGIVEPKCATGEVALISDNQGICGKACDKDGDCPAGQACHGSAAKFNKGKAGDSVQVCTVYHPHDAGAATPKPDAGGALTTVDAGGAAADAGGGSKLAPQSVMIAPSQLGACADNAHLVKKDNKCHIKCPKPADCDKFKGGATPEVFCGKCDGVNVCNAQRGFCGN